MWVIILAREVKLADKKAQPWKLSHRVDLHEALKWAAVSPNGGGTPVTLNLQSKVVACDPSAPSLTLDNGVMVNGDLLIAADGVHVGSEKFHSGRTRQLTET
jgi:salicylate hydroxylase